MRLYQVIGRKAPTANDENPPAYRMKIFAANEINAQSRFCYFMHQIRKMKKTNGEILDVNEVSEAPASESHSSSPVADMDGFPTVTSISLHTHLSSTVASTVL